jgi:cytoskeleton protein RodZ
MTASSFPGHELKERREALGLSEDDVYRKLRVPSHFVRTIETGALDQLPALTYTIGFLRTYCRLLELDSEPYVHDLTAAMRPARGFLGFGDKSAPRPRPAWMTEAITWLSICGIMLLGWLAYSVVVRPGSDPDRSEAQADELVIQLPEAPDRP